MRILFLADGRSPIATNWMRYFYDGSYEIHLVSLFPCVPEIPFSTLSILPVAFSTLTGEDTPSHATDAKRTSFVKRFARWAVSPRLRTALRHAFVPRSLPRTAHDLRRIVQDIRPDLVHAMRIPYEGMLASLALEGLPVPLLVSVWGNDFTLHASSSHALGELTRRTLRRADALHTDCVRDRDLARKWGFASHKPVVILPGGGGIQTEQFFPTDPLASPMTIINPRGMRAYVRNDTFFRAAALLHASVPRLRFLCPGMSGSAEAESWQRRTDTGDTVELLPRQTRNAMADLFRRSGIVLSITEHDGTPNTLLEALACGCFPILGDIPSMHEWVEEGVNGLFIPPGEPQALADAILRAVEDEELRARARTINLARIAEKASYPRVMGQAERFYKDIIFECDEKGERN